MPSATTAQAGGRRTDDASRLTPWCQTLLTHHGPADCGSCVACGMLWCSVAQRCFCAPDFTCDGKLTQAEHPLQYKHNEQMTGWCPDAWSGGCRSLDMCQHRASSGCDTCLAASTTTCSWCLYSDAAGSAASTCVYAGDNSAHFTNCNDRRMTVRRNAARTKPSTRSLALDLLLAPSAALSGAVPRGGGGVRQQRWPLRADPAHRPRRSAGGLLLPRRNGVP